MTVRPAKRVAVRHSPVPGIIVGEPVIVADVEESEEIVLEPALEARFETAL